ncbi:MAG: hypothetical protein GY786_17215 [Proteobacteria bacterium]|nr:hypothetical protein [Pseudomonadota bacterium]
MKILIESLTQEQLIWYSEMLIMAILADKMIKPTEVEFLKGVIGHINDDKERSRLIHNIKEGTITPLRLMNNVPKETSAFIFSHLIESCISDMEFDITEKNLLRKIGQLFDFKVGYIKQWLSWGDDGVEWKKFQQTIVRSRINNREFIVPIKAMNIEQKKWYIDIMVSALMLTGLRNEKEIDLLKYVLENTENKEEQKLLKAHIFKKHRPPMHRPPKMSEEVLTLIFMDLISIHTSKGVFSYQGEQQIKQLSDLSQITTASFTQIMDWCQRGLHWKGLRSELTSHVMLNASAEDEEAAKKGLLTTHPNNSSVQIRQLDCFMCESKIPLAAFQVKHYSQRMESNIFGVSKYVKANEGFDFIDFSKIKVIVCPNCLFAATDKTHFCKGEKDKKPVILNNPDFRKQWMYKKFHRLEMFNEKEGELKAIKRSLDCIVGSYRVAIETAQALLGASDDDSFLGKEVNLHLQLAEIYMQYKKKDLAIEELRIVQKVCQKIFTSSANDPLVINCAKILLLISLYFKETQPSHSQFDFFRDYKADKLIFLKYDAKNNFNKVYNEVEIIWERRELYSADELDGFTFKKELINEEGSNSKSDKQ